MLGTGIFQHGTAGDDDIAAAAIHLEDLERLVRAHQGRDVAHRPDIDLASGQERHGPVEIDREAALDPAEDDAGDPLAVLVGLLELFPRFFTARAFAAERGLAARCLEALDIDLDLVADLDFGRLSGRREFLERHASLNFEPDVDQGGVVLDRENGALDDASLEARRVVEELIEHVGEFLLCGGRLLSRLCDLGRHLISSIVGGRLGARPVRRTPRSVLGERVPRCGSRYSFLRGRKKRVDDGHCPIEHLIGSEGTGINPTSVCRRLQRCGAAPTVAGVAGDYFIQNARFYTLDTA